MLDSIPDLELVEKADKTESVYNRAREHLPFKTLLSKLMVHPQPPCAKLCKCDLEIARLACRAKPGAGGVEFGRLRLYH